MKGCTAPGKHQQLEKSIKGSFLLTFPPHPASCSAQISSTPSILLLSSSCSPGAEGLQEHRSPQQMLQPEQPVASG